MVKSNGVPASYASAAFQRRSPQSPSVGLAIACWRFERLRRGPSSRRPELLRWDRGDAPPRSTRRLSFPPFVFACDSSWRRRKLTADGRLIPAVEEGGALIGDEKGQRAEGCGHIGCRIRDSPRDQDRSSDPPGRPASVPHDPLRFPGTRQLDVALAAARRVVTALPSAGDHGRRGLPPAARQALVGRDAAPTAGHELRRPIRLCCRSSRGAVRVRADLVTNFRFRSSDGGGGVVGDCVVPGRRDGPDVVGPGVPWAMACREVRAHQSRARGRRGGPRSAGVAKRLCQRSALAHRRRLHVQHR